jgi:hypothetical protein
MIQLTVRVIPRASRRGIVGIRDGALLVRLQSPPVENAANQELIELLAKAFGTAKRDVAIVEGSRSRLKRIAISGIDPHRAQTILQSLS